MKKISKLALIAFCLLLAFTTLVACNNGNNNGSQTSSDDKTQSENTGGQTSSNDKTPNVVGVYKLTSISGTIGNVSVDKSMYEYFELILEKDGSATVHAKAANASEERNEKGTYVFENGKIKTTMDDGAEEVYDYENGTISFTANDESGNLTIVLTKDN